MISFFICLFLLIGGFFVYGKLPRKCLDRMTAAHRQSPWKMARTMYPWEPPAFS